MGVSRQYLYYRHIQNDKNWRLKVQIEQVMHDYPSYGYRRVAGHLKMNRKPVQRVMRIFGIKAHRRRGRKYRKNKNKSAANYPNLLLETMPQYQNHIWATDFTYIWFKDKFIYVSTVIDLFTRTVVGLNISARHDRWLVITAFLDALRHNSRPGILHSDHGREYTSEDYDRLISEVGTARSMSRPGCPWESGYQEGFYSQFKVDLGDPARFISLGELTAEIYRTIYVYNHTRIHSAFGISPLQFAERHGFAYN